MGTLHQIADQRMIRACIEVGKAMDAADIACPESLYKRPNRSVFLASMEYAAKQQWPDIFDDDE